MLNFGTFSSKQEYTLGGGFVTYWLFNVVLAVWTFLDTRKRNDSIGWVFAVVLVGVLALPVYLAKRSLRAGETREGGTGWNVLKNFALIWTIFMVINLIAGVINVSDQAATITDEWESAGYAIGATLGVGMLVGLWFFVMIAALVIGLFIKKSSVIETGPTGNIDAG